MELKIEQELEAVKAEEKKMEISTIFRNATLKAQIFFMWADW